MNTHSGDVYRIREELFGPARYPGESIEMFDYREQVAKLGAQASADEVAAMRSESLVRVTEEVATKLKLGAREQERRRRRRKSARRARRTNR
jgi:hypothetical protein